MGQITTTQNLVAIKEVRHAGQQVVSYRVGKPMIDKHTHGHTDAGNDNTRRPKLVTGKKTFPWSSLWIFMAQHRGTIGHLQYQC